MTEKRDEEAAAITLRQVFGVICNGPLRGLYLVLGLEIFGAALTIPIFSFFCIHELHLKATSVGILLSSFNLAQSLGGPIFGRISDAFGRRSILLLCFAWSSACFCLTSLVRGFYDLLAVRTMAGLSGGSIPVAAAFVMDCATSVERPGVLGFQGAFLGATFTCGPLLVMALLWMEGMVRRYIFLLAGIFCFLGFLLGLWILEESLPKAKRRPLCNQDDGAESSCAPVMDCYEVRCGLVAVWFARFFYAFGVFSLYATYAFVIKDNFGWSDWEFGMILGISGVSQGLLELFLYPVTDRQIGEHLVVILGCAIASLGLLLLYRDQLLVHVIAMVTFQIGQALCEPGFINLTGSYAPSERHMGFAMGVSNGFRAFASVVGPFTAGRLYDIDPMWTYMLASGMVAGGACIVFGAMLLDHSFSREKSEKVKLMKEGGCSP